MEKPFLNKWLLLCLSSEFLKPSVSVVAQPAFAQNRSQISHQDVIFSKDRMFRNREWFGCWIVIEFAVACIKPRSAVKNVSADFCALASQLESVP